MLSPTHAASAKIPVADNETTDVAVSLKLAFSQSRSIYDFSRGAVESSVQMLLTAGGLVDIW